MRRALAGLLGVALLLGACHRAPAGDAPDADADLRARTAAKTLSDLAAADAAARAPLPQAARPLPRQARPAADGGNAADATDDMAAPPPANDSD